jgi:hypothetical protein
MKRNATVFYLLFLFVFLSISSSAQLTRQPGSIGAISNHHEIKSFDIDSIQSLLFVFKGEGDSFSSVYFFLSNQLRRRWNKKVKFGFHYDRLKYKNEKVPAWMNLPVYKYQEPFLEPAIRVEIRLYRFKSKIFHANYEDSFRVNIELIDTKTNELMEYAQLVTFNRRERNYGSTAIAELLDMMLKE